MKSIWSNESKIKIESNFLKSKSFDSLYDSKYVRKTIS